jgi:hypothetical protein
MSAILAARSSAGIFPVASLSAFQTRFACLRGMQREIGSLTAFVVI